MAARAQERVDEELGALAASPLDEPAAEQMRALLAPSRSRQARSAGGSRKGGSDAGRAAGQGGARR